MPTGGAGRRRRHVPRTLPLPPRPGTVQTAPPPGPLRRRGGGRPRGGGRGALPRTTHPRRPRALRRGRRTQRPRPPRRCLRRLRRPCRRRAPSPPVRRTGPLLRLPPRDAPVGLPARRRPGPGGVWGRARRRSERGTGEGAPLRHRGGAGARPAGAGGAPQHQVRRHARGGRGDRGGGQGAAALRQGGARGGEGAPGLPASRVGAARRGVLPVSLAGVRPAGAHDQAVSEGRHGVQRVRAAHVRGRDGGEGAGGTDRRGRVGAVRGGGKDRGAGGRAKAEGG
mmetsp:Transcript_6850/g.14782  ORF Transcript_6850/g.14782 Transcript_6850/m.14782 type:complete len:282 (-) Transcript_6850:228-1073(-)